MRIGLIAALRRSEDGTLRAALPLAGRSVLAWQADQLRSLGVGRVLCLAERAEGEILALQHELEAQGVQFHAIRNHAALPALVRAQDDLIVLLDGLVPDPAVVSAAVGGGTVGGSPGGETGGLQRAVATIPADHPLAAAYPHDFERIDAARCWAGVLAMRGAPVQQLADFPADADAISLLLRLALQSGTPANDLASRALVPESLLLADSAEAAARHERAMIARAAPRADWRAPAAGLAAMIVRAAAPGGIGQGALIAGGGALAVLLAAVMAAAFGMPTVGLGLAAMGAFGAQISAGFAALSAGLYGAQWASRAGSLLGLAVDVLAALTLWFALAPSTDRQALAVLGPVVITLARIVARSGEGANAAAASDRPGLLLILALGAAIGLLPETLACLALGLVAALLLRGAPD